jgi:hypothetical protein
MPWKDKPKGMSEGFYRTMAKTIKVEVRGVEYTLQSVSPSWFYDTCDKYGITGDKQQRTKDFRDIIIKNCVVSPTEVREKGLKYFDDTDDIAGSQELFRAIDSFLVE